MLATPTTQGQATLPKEIRDTSKLGAGAKLDLVLQSDGPVTLEPLQRSALSVAGLLKREGRAVSALAEVDDAIGAYLAEKSERVRRTASPATTDRKS
jgi:bifunctional DNA-binding transcriptional regulator/antitoxin component of YhaV-PrlF toxin-antitoxin module